MAGHPTTGRHLRGGSKTRHQQRSRLGPTTETNHPSLHLQLERSCSSCGKLPSCSSWPRRLSPWRARNWILVMMFIKAERFAFCSSSFLFDSWTSIAVPLQCCRHFSTDSRCLSEFSCFWKSCFGVLQLLNPIVQKEDSPKCWLANSFFPKTRTLWQGIDNTPTRYHLPSVATWTNRLLLWPYSFWGNILCLGWYAVIHTCSCPASLAYMLALCWHCQHLKYRCLLHWKCRPLLLQLQLCWQLQLLWVLTEKMNL